VTPALMALCLLTSHEQGLPAGLLTSVVLAETSGRSVVARGRGKGGLGCDVGVAQIHIPGCRPEAVAAVLPVARNLVAAARVLRWSRSWCSRRPSSKRCSDFRWFRYNPGSRTWSSKVRRIWGVIIKLAHSTRNPEESFHSG